MALIRSYKSTIERGDIIYVETYYQEGSEQKAGRPAIIVSNDRCNESSPVVEVVYLTTQNKNYLPTHVYIRSATKPSIALCEQIHSISKSRLGDYVSTCTEDEMKNIDIALAVSLGLDDMVKEVVVENVVEVVEPVEKIVEVPVPTADSSELIKIAAERDVYKGMYEQLLNQMIARKI